MTVYFDSRSGSSQQAEAVKSILRATEPDFVLPALATAGFASVIVNGDGNVFNISTGLFLTTAQLAALLPGLPHAWGSPF